MTCQSAGVPFTEYLKFVYKNKDKMAEEPDNFTPYAFSKIMRNEIPNSMSRAG